MPFESGSVSFRLFHVPHKMPDDVIDRFAARAAVPLDTVSNEPMYGWVTGRHLLARHITEETATYGGYLRLALQQAERKVPPALQRAEARMEELAQLAADHKEFLNRNEKSAIRKSVTERLLPESDRRNHLLPVSRPRRTSVRSQLPFG